ncbi:hypothetical protein [Peribacillus sp. Bi96]|uniref:hypothetical protein n=1 Tax=Peribacillus sp. Bi96 TaxID=2884273 RepID=UPI001E313C09|nr:hypothetical protein [Peribacillus sp. Bi96]
MYTFFLKKSGVPKIGSSDDRVDNGNILHYFKLGVNLSRWQPCYLQKRMLFDIVIASAY